MKSSEALVSKYDKLKEVLKEYKDKRIAICIVGSPDPDSISSSIALGTIFTHYGIEYNIYRTEPIAASNNVRMINELNITEIKELESFESINNKYDAYAVLDWKDPNIGLTIPCAIHVDHHKAKQLKTEPRFQYINEDVGSVATIFALWLEIEDMLNTKEGVDKISTALSYGIYSDTKGLRLAYHDDHIAMAYLHSYIDVRKFMSISRVSISKSALNSLKFGIDPTKDNLTIKDSVLICGVGILKESKQDESLAIMADQLFICIQNVNTAIVYGIVKPTEEEPYIRGSVRNVDSSFEFDRVLKQISKNSGNKSFDGGFVIKLGPLASIMKEEELWQRAKELIESKVKDEFEFENSTDDTTKSKD